MAYPRQVCVVNWSFQSLDCSKLVAADGDRGFHRLNQLAMTLSSYRLFLFGKVGWSLKILLLIERRSCFLFLYVVNTCLSLRLQNNHHKNKSTMNLCKTYEPFRWWWCCSPYVRQKDNYFLGSLIPKSYYLFPFFSWLIAKAWNIYRLWTFRPVHILCTCRIYTVPVPVELHTFLHTPVLVLASLPSF